MTLPLVFENQILIVLIEDDSEVTHCRALLRLTAGITPLSLP
jgi:hypothetical protein